MLLNMKVTMMPIEDGALEMVPKGLEKGLEEMEMRKNRDYPDKNRIPRRVLESWEELLSLRLQWTITSWRWYEKHVKREKRDKTLPEN